MNNIVKFSDVTDKIITIREQKVLLDCDVAALYGVETRDINKSVKNNPDKFPDGYIIFLSDKEKTEVVENFHHLVNIKFSPVLPKAFTKKGCYTAYFVHSTSMLATILKSPQATQTTIAIIEAFDKLSELQEIVAELPETTDEKQQKSLVQRGGEIISDLIGNNPKTSEEETSFEINLAMVKFKHTVKRKS